MKKYTVIGIDEAGRGPLAGPITVAAIAGRNSRPRFLKNIRDSKKLSAKQRNEWLKVLKDNFEYHVSMIGPEVIDKFGISRATKIAVARVLRKFGNEPDLVLLDGSLFAPKHYRQQTIIKGDEKVAMIAAASIVAKESRDAKMLRLHKKFPQYCFDKHKGYGTKLHYKMLKHNGLSPLHRRLFCHNLKRA
jgi:ribonuclease HII